MKNRALPRGAGVFLTGTSLGAAVLPSGILIDLALVVLVVALVRHSTPGILRRIQVPSIPEVGTLAAMLGGQLASLGGVLYLAAFGLSRLLAWGTAHKVIALITAAAAAGVAFQFDGNWLWFTQHASELEAGMAGRAILPLP